MCVLGPHIHAPAKIHWFDSAQPSNPSSIIPLFPGCPLWSPEPKSYYVSKLSVDRGFEIPDKGKRNYDPFGQKPR